MKTLQHAGSLKNKTVLIRTDLNVPILEGKVRDAFRIEKALKSIKLLVKKGARVIVISHIGEGKTDTLLPVFFYLKKKKVPCVFLDSFEKNAVEKVLSGLKKGQFLLLENVRHESGEKENSQEFAKKLASLADIYVNDAFSVSHREHASIVGVPKYLPSYAGLQMTEEIKNLSLALVPSHPFVFVLGGAKISTKLPLITRYLKSADEVFVGGAILNNILRDKKLPIGDSLVDDTETPRAILNSPKILPVLDVVTENHKGVSRTVLPLDVHDDEKIVDIGPETITSFKPIFSKAKLIVWNGPLGNYEKGYDKGTIQLLKLLASLKAKTILGGGDTVALVTKLKLEKKFTFVSTGGGATLDFLAHGTLPGIKALK
jgi:phosphoglycerate kinase